MGYPADLLFYATYDSTADADYFPGGSVTATNTGGVSIDTSIKNCGLGSAKFPGTVLSYLSYSGTINVDQTGCVSFWCYLTAASQRGILVEFYDDPPVAANRILVNVWNGHFEASIRDNTGFNIVYLIGSTVVSLNAWHHIEFNFDVTSGASRLFVDGTVDASDLVSTFDHDVMSPGLAYVSSRSFVRPLVYIDDVQLYNTVQNTANFTPACASFGPTNKIFNNFASPYGSPMARGFGR